MQGSRPAAFDSSTLFYNGIQSRRGFFGGKKTEDEKEKIVKEPKATEKKEEKDAAATEEEGKDAPAEKEAEEEKKGESSTSSSEEEGSEDPELSAKDVKRIKLLFNEQETEIKSLEKKIADLEAVLTRKDNKYEEKTAESKRKDGEIKLIRIEYTKQVKENE